MRIYRPNQCTLLCAARIERHYVSLRLRYALLSVAGKVTKPLQTRNGYCIVIAVASTGVTGWLLVHFIYTTQHFCYYRIFLINLVYIYYSCHRPTCRNYCILKIHLDIFIRQRTKLYIVITGSCRCFVALLFSSVWIVTVRDRCECMALSKNINKKLSYRRVTARCVLSVVILPVATQQYRNYLYDKSWPNWWYEVGGLVGGNVSWTMCTQP